jgi:hypothetical protein
MPTEFKERLAWLADDVHERPDAFQRLSDFRRLRMRRRRVLTLLLSVVVTASSTALLLRAFEGGGREGGTDPSPAPEGVLALNETYVDDLGWSIDYPDGWYELPIDQFTGRFSLQGSAFSNEPLVPADDEGFGGDPYPDLSRLSHTAVVLIVTHRSGGPAPTLGDDSEFPLDPGDAQVIPGPVPAGAVIDFRGDGLGDFTLRFGGFADAPSELYEVLDRMIRTIRFVPWEVGDVRNGFEAIGGNVSEGRGEAGFVHRLGLIYAMNVGSELYILDVPDVSCEGQNQTWDPSTRQILLEGPCYGEIRYDVNGVPDVANPPEYQERLDRHPVVTAWDGTPLVALGVTLG